MSNEITQQYAKKFRIYELTWSPYFHYGIFKSDEDLLTAQEQTLDVIAKMAGVSSSSKVLDVGSGIGSSCLYLATKYGCFVTGIDPVEDQVVYSKERTKIQKLQNLATFQLGRADAIPLENKTFDAVISNEVFCHIKDKEQALSECYRVLNFGGWFILSDLFDKVGGTQTRPFHEYLKHALPMLSLNQYRKVIADSDFQCVEVLDWSHALPKNYEKALEVLKANEREVFQEFGEAEFNATKAFYELCLTSPIKNGIGWAIFVCRK